MPHKHFQSELKNNEIDKKLVRLMLKFYHEFIG
jgi:hypothetical protein